MKRAILYSIIILLGSIAQADSEEVVLTSVSYHPMIDPRVYERLSNKMGNGFNFNPMMGYARTYNDMSFYSSYKGFVGLNCVNQPMIGAMASAGAAFEHAELGLVAGMYYQDVTKFYDVGVDPYFGDLTPIIGFELNFKIPMKKHSFLKITNTFATVVINTALSVGWNF